MRGFENRPYNAKDDCEIKPTRKTEGSGAASRGMDTSSLVNTINATYPSLGDAQRCYYGDDHMNQIGWLECLSANPSSTTRLSRSLATLEVRHRSIHLRLSYAYNSISMENFCHVSIPFPVFNITKRKRRRTGTRLALLVTRA